MTKQLKRVSICALARELGLSDRAVSQALYPRESNVKLSPETIARVRKLARLRKYHSARPMRAGRFHNIGYFEAKKNLLDFPLRGADGGICDAAGAHNYRVVLVKLPDDLSRAHNTIQSFFREAHLDALIVSHLGDLRPEFKEAIDDSGLPVVYLNEKKPTNSVYVDDVGGMEKLVGALASAGYRRMAYHHIVSSAPVVHYSDPDRLKGYERAMKKAGLRPRIIPLGSEWKEELQEWLQANRDVDAVICSNDLQGLRFFQVLERTGQKVPRDLGLAAYGGDLAGEAPVDLTTMRIPFYEMGKAAVELALARFDSRGDVRSKVFQAELLVRASTPRLS